MKKFFTLFAAALFATALFAQNTEKNPSDPATVTTDQDLAGISYTIPATQVAGGGSKIIGDMWDKGVKVRINKKHGDISNALPFLVTEGKKITAIKIVGVTNKDGVAANFTSAIVDGTTVSISGSLPSKDGSASGLVEIKDIEALESVVFVSDGNGGQALICYEITYDDAIPSTDPELSVSPEEVTLELTAAKLADVAYVTFKGKNLTAGDYAFTMPNLDGLRADPSFVTVGADGKLNQQVAIAYSSDVDVAPASTEIFLTINALEAVVKVNYSASFAKEYLSKSVNIEQLVLDNGVNYDIESEFRAAHIEFENLNALDSLNDEKTARNEPYLGLKLKKQGAFVACWLKKGDRIAIKFGAVKDAVKIGVNGEYQDYPASDESSFIAKTAEQDDEYLEIITKSDKTVVLKQIMFNEDIAEVTLPDSTQGVEDIEAGAKATKTIIDGQLVIIKNGVRYNALGTQVK